MQRLYEEEETVIFVKIERGLLDSSTSSMHMEYNKVLQCA